MPLTRTKVCTRAKNSDSLRCKQAPQSEFACGLRLGVVITSRPSRVTEASNSAEKIVSWSWMMKRYS